MNNIETIKYDKVGELYIKKFVRFLCKHYLRNNENCHTPKKNNIMPYFEGHNDLSFLSFYFEDELLIDLKKGTTIPEKRLVGIMSSRPLHVAIYNRSSPMLFDTYYVDHLCVDTLYRQKGIAPQIIQTHHYQQRHHNRNISVSLFKREDKLTGIVPLCVYTTYGFFMNRITKLASLQGGTSIVECGKSNIHILFDFMKEYELNKTFDICIQPELSNLLELINTKNIFVFMMVEDNEVRCAYFFRKVCTFIKNDCEAVSCIASICGNVDEDLFIYGYNNALWVIAEKEHFGFSIIENISHNDIIVTSLLKSVKPCIQSPTAYFFYNFAYPTFSPKKTFILN